MGLARFVWMMMVRPAAGGSTGGVWGKGTMAAGWGFVGVARRAVGVAVERARGVGTVESWGVPVVSEDV